MNSAVFLAFGAGIAAAFNPCGLAMLPATIGLLLGTQSGAAASWTARALRGLAAGILLGLGFTLVVAVAAGLVSLLAHAALRLLPYLMVVLAAVLVVAGVLMALGRLAVGIATGQVRGRLEAMRVGFAGTLLAFGVAYGLAALSCTLPLFIALVAEAASLGWGGAILTTAAFAVGVTVVLTVVAVGTAFGQRVLEGNLRRVQPYVPRVGGIIVIAAALWIAYYWLIGPGRLPSSVGRPAADALPAAAPERPQTPSGHSHALHPASVSLTNFAER